MGARRRTLLLVLFSLIVVTAKALPLFYGNYSLVSAAPKGKIVSDRTYEDKIIRIEFDDFAGDYPEFTLRNISNTPLTIVWDLCAYVDNIGRSQRVFKTDMRYLDIGKSIPPTLVIPGAYVEEAIVPVDSVEFDSEWIVHNSIPKEANQTISIVLTIEQQGKQTTYTFKLTSEMLGGEVFVESGDFLMDDYCEDIWNDEEFKHRVIIAYDFYIGKYEVTFTEYDQFCDVIGRTKPSDGGWGRGNRPVRAVTWWDAIAYCNWLSEKEGLPNAYDEKGNLLDEYGNITSTVSNVVGYRLPTEAEWEYASKGGNKSRGYRYAGSDYLDEVAWFSDNSFNEEASTNTTWPVGQKKPNELGIYDMVGNVWEWCSDSDGYYPSSVPTDPFRSSGDRRVVRGGGYGLDELNIFLLNRLEGFPTDIYKDVGFRICRTGEYKGGNRPPVNPHKPEPSNADKCGKIPQILSWNCYDADYDVLSYDIYLDTKTDQMTKVASNHTDSIFSLGPLSYNTNYYWRIVAKDSEGGITEGPIWSFSTHISLYKPSSEIQEMVLVEKGSFTMGDTWGDSWVIDRPTHRVTLTYDFYIGKYETTFVEYDAFCEATGRSKPSDENWGRGDRPVINVSWWDAIAYCNWLSEMEGLPKAYDEEGNFLDIDGELTTDPSRVVGYRLPTEAEWEYAAKGGNKSEGFRHAGSDTISIVAWYDKNSEGITQLVGKKAPNELGIYDMSGNVCEWCSDSFREYSKSSVINPFENNEGYPRVVRGFILGVFFDYASVSYRSVEDYTSRDYIGIRICRSVPYEGMNRPPYEPNNSVPTDQEQGKTTILTLSWSGGDPDGDEVTYEIYLGKDRSPSLIERGLKVLSYVFNDLDVGTTYHWKVVARDSKGEISEGPIWTFTTHVDTSLYKPTHIVPSMVFVEKGSFTMGDIWGDGDPDERPLHEVSITYDFCIGKYEITFEEFDFFSKAAGWSKPNDQGLGRGDRPVINVIWWDAIAYCNWLSEMEGLPKAYDEEGNFLDIDGELTTDPSRVVGYRLPTEAEWEYAARGGNKSKGYKYSGSDNVDDVAWYISNSGWWTQEVGKKLLNELGIYDMSGNVWEWCSDSYGNYSDSTQTNPYNSTAGSDRVYRGGGVHSDVQETRVTNREDDFWSNYPETGFRICRTLPFALENRSPFEPNHPSPSNNSINQPTTITLNWECIDPDGDPMSYSIYFDTKANLTTEVASDVTTAKFHRNNLLCRTTYYWKIVARDSKGNITEGPVWRFTTLALTKSMVLVEKGNFTMGDTWGDGSVIERPTHRVMLTYDFYIGKYETTFVEYDAFCEATGRSKPSDENWGRGDRPVINVSWWDAIAYCNWLSEMEGLPKAYDEEGSLLDSEGKITTDPSKVVGYRLPTEAEWEYAARGGKESKGYKYAGGSGRLLIGVVAWYDKNSEGITQLVGKKAPNELGIYDMSGNVCEWCSDWYGPYSSTAQLNAYNDLSGSSRVIRGGSWYFDEAEIRISNRNCCSPSDIYSDFGFRICRTVPYEGKNRPPLSPCNPNPADEAIVGATTVTIGWDSYDPDGDVMTYDVYFDTNVNPTTKASSNQTENTLIRSNLSYDTTYYWKVVAKDNHGGVTESPVWKFTTSVVAEGMVLVEKGSFTMGDTWGDGYSNEKPTHKVTFAYDFYIGKYETTFDEYDAFCEDTGRSKPYDYGWGRGTRPVLDVSWWDAVAYCNWLNTRFGLPVAYDNNGNLMDKDGMITTDPSKVAGYRLPTEAEWEYAARGGNKSKGYKYSGRDNIDEVAWYKDNSGSKTQEVGKKAPNELGIYDMSGNVWEWCSDWFEYYSSSAQTNPYNSTAGSSQVLRGGSCYYSAAYVRVTNRSSYFAPILTVDGLGFRIARTVP